MRRGLPSRRHGVSQDHQELIFPFIVIPAQAGIHVSAGLTQLRHGSDHPTMDPRFRGGDHIEGRWTIL